MCAEEDLRRKSGPGGAHLIRGRTCRAWMRRQVRSPGSICQETTQHKDYFARIRSTNKERIVIFVQLIQQVSALHMNEVRLSDTPVKRRQVASECLRTAPRGSESLQFVTIACTCTHVSGASCQGNSQRLLKLKEPSRPSVAFKDSLAKKKRKKSLQNNINKEKKDSPAFAHSSKQLARREGGRQTFTINDCLPAAVPNPPNTPPPLWSPDSRDTC